MDDPRDSIEILIATEQDMIRKRLRHLVAAAPDLRIVGEAADGRSAFALVRDVRPHVLLIDLGLPQRSQTAALTSLTSWRAQIVVMVEAIETAQVLDAFRIGAQAIVPKMATSEQLLSNIRNVAAGNYFLSSEVIAILVGAVRDLLVENCTATSPQDHALTPRELEIIAKISAGLSNKEVGQEFSISERTVKHHLTNIFNKTGVSNRLALALFALNHRLVGAPGPDGMLRGAVHNRNSLGVHRAGYDVAKCSS